MKTRIELDKKDIIKLIADHFDVDVKDVDLRVVNVYTGCGPMETVTPEPVAIIESKTVIWD